MDALPVCPIADGAITSYDIVRDERVIGRHVLQFAVANNEMTVNIAVDASLYAVGIRVYHYEHRGREVWRNGEMLSMVTQTKDDGTKQSVSARRDPTTGTWRGVRSSDVIVGALFPTSLWNSRTIQQTRLMDHETGEVTTVQVTEAGKTILEQHGVSVPAKKYDLVGGTSGSVWYDEQGCWAKAIFKSPVDGSLIDVERR